MTDESYREAAKRAQGVFAAVDKGLKVSPDARVRRVDVAQQVAMIELMVHDVRDGQLQPASFLQHPAHLPEGKELKKLLQSAADKDRQLRADAIEWCQVNRREVARAATSLRNAVTAVRMANQLLNDGDAPDETELYGWMNEIDAYVRATFAVDPRNAPTDAAELYAWCQAATDRANPTPTWLRDFRPGQAVFTAKPKSMAEEFAKHMSDSNHRNKESDDE